MGAVRTVTVLKRGTVAVRRSLIGVKKKVETDKGSETLDAIDEIRTRSSLVVVRDQRYKHGLASYNIPSLVVVRDEERTNEGEQFKYHRRSMRSWL